MLFCGLPFWCLVLGITYEFVTGISDDNLLANIISLSKNIPLQFVKKFQTHQVLLCLGKSVEVCVLWAQNQCRRISQPLSLSVFGRDLNVI